MVIKARILVAEDDADDQLLLKTAFAESEASAELTFVRDGVELLEYLDGVADDHIGAFPDLVLLDLNMPRKSGKEALAQIKSHPVYRKVPVVIYTTTRDAAEVRRCYELGANNYIVKPSSFDSMVEIVTSLFDYWIATASLPSRESLGKMPAEKR